MSVVPIKHGVASIYQRGCKCDSCTVANRKAQRKKYAQVREILARYKLEQGCAECGYDTYPGGLELDHIIPLHKTGDKRLAFN